MSEYLVLLGRSTVGLLTLAAYPVLVQWWFFGLTRDAVQWSVSGLIGSAALAVACLLTGLAGVFNFWTATGLALVLLVVARWGMNRWPRPRSPVRATRTEIVVLALFLLFALGGLAIRRYPYAPDWRRYMSGGADLVESGGIAALDLVGGDLGYSNAPVTMLLDGYVFGAWGSTTSSPAGSPFSSRCSRCSC